MMKVETANYRLDPGDERLWHGDQPVQISKQGVFSCCGSWWTTPTVF